MKRGIGLSLKILGLDRDQYKFYLMSLPREKSEKLCPTYTKTHIYMIKYWRQRLNRLLGQCEMNLKIKKTQRCLEFLGTRKSPIY